MVIRDFCDVFVDKVLEIDCLNFLKVVGESTFDIITIKVLEMVESKFDVEKSLSTMSKMSFSIMYQNCSKICLEIH